MYIPLTISILSYLGINSRITVLISSGTYLLDGLVLGGIGSAIIGTSKLTASGISKMINKIKGEGPEAVNKFKETYLEVYNS